MKKVSQPGELRRLVGPFYLLLSSLVQLFRTANSAYLRARAFVSKSSNAFRVVCANLGQRTGFAQGSRPTRALSVRDDERVELPISRKIWTNPPFEERLDHRVLIRLEPADAATEPDRIR